MPAANDPETMTPSPHLLASISASDIGEWLLALVVLGLLVWSLRWVYADAEARGKDGCLVAVIVFLVCFPISLLVWLALRPKLRQPLTESESGRLN